MGSREHRQGYVLRSGCCYPRIELSYWLVTNHWDLMLGSQVEISQLTFRFEISRWNLAVEVSRAHFAHTFRAHISRVHFAPAFRVRISRIAHYIVAYIYIMRQPQVYVYSCTLYYST